MTNEEKSKFLIMLQRLCEDTSRRAAYAERISKEKRNVYIKFILFCLFFSISSIESDANQTLSSQLIFLFNKDFAAHYMFNVKEKLNLDGDTLSMPDNCVVFFSGGKICNGVIRGNDLFFSGRLDDCFENVYFEGSHLNPNIDYSWFNGYPNDTALMRGMLSFLFSNSCIDCELSLCPGREYQIYHKKMNYGSAIFEFFGKRYKKINGNNATIVDLRTRNEIGYSSYDGVFLFNNCHYITINNLNYKNLNEDYVEIRENGKTKFKEGIENQIGYTGTSYILLQNDCSNFNIDAKIGGARYGVKSGDYSKYWLCGDFGLKNSTINIISKKSGYPVAIELGDSLNITIESEQHHRAAYLCGISNSVVNIKAKDIYIAPYHCLLNDSRYSKSFEEKPKYKSCSNSIITVIDTGSSVATNGDCFCVGLQTYKTFLDRKEPLCWENLTINVTKSAYAPRIGLFSLTRMETETDSDPRNINDTFSNIRFCASDSFPSEQYSFRVRIGESAILKRINFEIDAPFGTGIIENKNQYEFDFANSTLNEILYISKN